MTVFAAYRDQVTSKHSNGVAADWPDLLGKVEDRVFPVRRNLNCKPLLDRWWHCAEKRPGLYRTIKGLDRVLAISGVGQNPSFCVLPNGMVYPNRLILLPCDSHSAVCILRSRPHEIWIRKLGSTLRDDPAYTP